RLMQTRMESLPEAWLGRPAATPLPPLRPDDRLRTADARSFTLRCPAGRVAAWVLGSVSHRGPRNPTRRCNPGGDPANPPARSYTRQPACRTAHRCPRLERTSG